MFEFFRRVFNPPAQSDILFLVYNDEAYVGSFMQAIFRTPDEAEAYIKNCYEGRRKQVLLAYQESGDEWGEFNFSPEPLKLSISTYNTRTHELKAYSGAY